MLFETLEPRQLLAWDSSPSALGPESQALLVASAVQPKVIATRPAAGATNVLLDVAVAADLYLPNAGIDASTLTSSTVKLYKTNTGTRVSANLDTTGGGDAIIAQPTSYLASSTSYTFEVTSGLKDTSGASFEPFKVKFNTGTKTSVTPTTVAFKQSPQGTTTGKAWTGLAFGPDGKLYGGTLDGRIYRFSVDSNGNLGVPQTITTVQSNNGGSRLLSGFAFDPRSTADNLILWASHSQYALEGASDWTGKISKLSGSNLQNYQDAVINLPRAVRDHVTNQPTFGPDGALYVPQGSMSAMGQADNAWGNRSEHLLSGAILRLDTTQVGAMAIDAKTESGGTYNPHASGAALTIYASGVRNAYDGVWHRNGHYFVPTNGSAAGGNTPAGDGAPALTNLNETQSDYLYDVREGGYYGHPNPKRGEYILNGGNPTSDPDPGEIVGYPVGTDPDDNYRSFAWNFGKNFSANGIIEYKGEAFGGTLDGKLLVTRYAAGDDVLILAPNADGGISGATIGATGLTGFNDPLDLVQSPTTGFIYVAEYGGQRITLLRPDSELSPSKPQMVFADMKDSTAGESQAITFKNESDHPISIPTSGFTLTGTDAGQFVITSKPSATTTLNPGQSVTVQVAFKASTSTSFGIKTARLRVQASTGRPPVEIGLRGLALNGSRGGSEPSLQKLLDLYRIPVKVGDSDREDNPLPLPVQTPNDEVTAQKLYKAGSGDVMIETLAVYSPTASPALRAGWYPIGSSGNRHQIFAVHSSDSQSVDIDLASGVTRFDPGSSAFGLYTEWPTLDDRRVYSEDALNTWESSSGQRRKARFYPLKTAEGVVVSNACVVGWEELADNIFDFQDTLFIVRNVSLTPPQASTPMISSLKLLNADTGSAIQSLNNGAVIDLKDVGGRLNVEALVGGGVESVRFILDGNTRIENTPRYLMQGGDGDDITAWTPAVGSHTLAVVAFAEDDADGTASSVKKVNFTIVDSRNDAERFAAYINFQPQNVAKFNGYKVDKGSTFGDRGDGLTFGWSSDNRMNVVDRDSSNAKDQRFDTFAAMGDRSWSIAVPNGTYKVYVLMGDPSDHRDSVYGVTVEGTPAAQGTPSPSRLWIGEMVTVQVTDGLLTIANAAGSRNNKISLLQIMQQP